MARGFGGRAEVLVCVLGSGEEEVTEGGAPLGSGGAAAELGFEWGEVVRGGGEEAVDELGVRVVSQRADPSLCSG